VIEDSRGALLRRFLDTNDDGKVDQWCYYKDGLEVYRDIDSDFDGKVDQCRWYNTAGTRWGMDRDQDGTIDSWRMISPEETTQEVVAALAARDADRFARVLLSEEDLRSLGLGEAKAGELAAKVTGAAARFKTMAAQQKLVTPESKWAQFSGSHPGVVPAGTEGSTKDLEVYESVVAIVRSGSDHGQLYVGTLIKVGNAWRVIDCPQAGAEGQGDAAAAGFFFRGPAANRPQVAAGGPNEKAQGLLNELEKLDAAVNRATDAESQAPLNAKRADLLEQLAAEATKPEDRAAWVRQMADVVSAAVQSGGYPDGVKRLEALLERLRKNEEDGALAAYVRFRQLTAEYGLAVQAKGADFAKVQTEWLKKLEQYVVDYPKSPDAAEAMLQLALGQEFAGQEDEARKWYGQIVRGFPEAPVAKKAAGARNRLDSVGKVLELQGKGTSGEVVELAKLRGKVVLVQYWATWSEPSKADMAVLKDLLDKHGSSGFAVIGVNLDTNTQAMSAFLTENKLPWAQIHEEGGLESRPAVELGILTLPTMILVDREGKVVNRNIGTSELVGELKKLIR
jgi:thiol-disulfide isomerase/thioredoxin